MRATLDSSGAGLRHHRPEQKMTHPPPSNRISNVLLRVTAGGTSVTETTLPLVGSGVVSAGVLLTIPGTSFDRGEVRVIVDPDGTSTECDETDNDLVVGDPR